MLNIRRIACLAALLSLANLAAADPAPAAPVAFSDTMTDASGKLNGRSLGDGKTVWASQPAFVLSPSGTMSASANGGWATFPVPRMTGKYVLHVELDPDDKGSVFVALGRHSLGDNAFGSEAEVSAGLSHAGYEISAAGQKIKFGSAKEYGGNRAGGNSIDVEVDTVAGILSVRINDTALLDKSPLPALTTLRIAKAGFVFYGPVTPNTSSIKNLSVKMTPAAASGDSPTVGLTPVSLTDFYLTPDTDSTVHWKAELPGTRPDDEYVLTDYTGAVVQKGKAQIAKDGTVTATLKLPAGFYELTFPDISEAFGLVSITDPPTTPDPYFCMDAGLSTLQGTGSSLHTDQITPELREGYVGTMHRLGIAMVRERMNISGVAPAPNVWHWESPARPFDSVRKLEADNHLPVLDMLWGTTKTLGISKFMPYCTDLPELAKTWETVAERYHANWAGTEIWNEPDLIGVPADQYVPMVKAVSYAYQQGKIETPIVSGVFAKVPPLYLQTCVANGMLDASDAVSFHQYDSPKEMLVFVRSFRAALKAGGREATPLWITESGLPWGPGRSRAPVDRDSLTGLSIAGKAVEGRALGLARYCPFYLPPWGNPNNFGMTDMLGTPQRSLGAYGYCIAALSGKTYRGDLDVPGAELARVFGDGKSMVAVISMTKPDAAATVKLPLAPIRLAGIDGRALKAAADGSIPVPDGITYAWLDPAAATTAVKSNADVTALYALGQQPAPARSPEAPVILQNGMDLGKITHSSQRYLLDQASAQTLDIPAVAWNLSDQPVQATLHLELPNNIAVTDADKTVTVPPGASVTTTWTVDATKALDVAETRFIRVTGKTSAGAAISPLAIPLMMEGDLSAHLARHSIHDRLPVEDLKRWRKNIGTGTMETSVDGTTWKMDCTFTGGANWVFPKFDCPPLDPAKYTGILLRARIAKAARHISFALRYPPDAHGGFEVNEIVPSDGEWHVVYLPFTDFVPEAGTDPNATLDITKVTEVMTGFVSSADNTMEISDMIAVGGTAHG